MGRTRQPWIRKVQYVPRDKPPMLMEARRAFVFLPLLIVVAERAVAQAMPYWWRIRRLEIVLAALGCVVLAAVIHAIRFRRRLQAIGYAACLNCGYELSGLPATHVCPECGRPFHINTVRATWRYYTRWR